MNNFKKIDVLLALVIGSVNGLIIVLIAKNLAVEIPVIEIALRFKNIFILLLPFLCVAILISSYYISRVSAVLYQFAKFILVGSLNFLG